MIRIRKNHRVPEAFLRTQRKYSSYDEITSSDKNDIKTILLEEQNYKCAYCMSKINLDNSTVEHYIPRNGPNGDISLSLDYRNLFAVCNTTRGLPKSEQTCDVSKGKRLLHIDPRIQANIDTINYDRSGCIRSSYNSGVNNFDDDINQILNLNSVQLVMNRQNAYQTLLNRMSKKKDTTWKKTFIQKYIDELSKSDNKTPYSGYLIFMLKKHL